MSALITALDGEKNLIARKLHQTPYNSSTSSSDSESGCRLGYPRSNTTQVSVREVARELDLEEVNDEVVCLEV